MTHDTVVTDPAAIRNVVERFGNLSVSLDGLTDEDDLFRAGMSSHASVSVMLALEASFGIEFPDSMLRRSTFESIAAIRRNIARLLEDG